MINTQLHKLLSMAEALLSACLASIFGTQTWIGYANRSGLGPLTHPRGGPNPPCSSCSSLLIVNLSSPRRGRGGQRPSRGSTQRHTCASCLDSWKPPLLLLPPEQLENHHPEIKVRGLRERPHVVPAAVGLAVGRQSARQSARQRARVSASSAQQGWFPRPLC